MELSKLNRLVYFTLVIVFILSFNDLSAKDITNEISGLSNSTEMITTIDNYQVSCFETFNYVQLKRDCTVRIKNETYDLEVTFEDVTWFQCMKMKLAAWWDRTF